MIAGRSVLVVDATQEDGTKVSARARRLDVDDEGMELIEALEPFRADGEGGHIFVPGEPRWVHPLDLIATFTPA